LNEDTQSIVWFYNCVSRPGTSTEKSFYASRTRLRDHVDFPGRNPTVYRHHSSKSNLWGDGRFPYATRDQQSTPNTNPM